MECQALQELLKSSWWLTEDNTKSDVQCDMKKKLAAHLSSCTICRKNIIDISKDILSEDALTCEECCLLLPKYYEEMHPTKDGLHLTSMKTSDSIEVVIHLHSCASCRTSYNVLAKLWDEDLL